TIAEKRSELLQGLERRVGAGMLIDRDNDVRPSLTFRGRDRIDLAGKKTSAVGLGILFLRCQRKPIAGLARKLIVAGKIVRGLGHRAGAKLLLDLRVGKAGTQR